MTGQRRAKRAKFRVGQVVCFRKGWPYEGHYGRIEGMYEGKDHIYYELAPEGLRVAEICVRPLTKRESGR